MTIAVDARFLGPAGTGLGKYAEKLLENLEKIDRTTNSGQVKNQYSVLLKKENFELFTPRSKNFTKVLADIPWYSLAEQIQIPQILAKVKPDVTHFCHFNVPLLYSGKFVVTIHDLIKHEFAGLASTTRFPLIYFFKHQTYKFVIGAAIQKSAKILVPSNWVKKRILEEFRISPEKIVITYEAADEAFIRELDAQDERQNIMKKYGIQTPFFIYVGNLYPYKNLELVLKALKILEKEIPDLKFLIASARDVFHQRFGQLVKDYRLENKVIMPGFIPTNDLAGLYKSAEAFVFPSLSEGFGIPGLDAMLAGLPVLVSNIPVFYEVYGEAVLYFDPKNERDLAEKIKLIFKNQKLRQELIAKGKKQVQKYSWQKMAKETLAVYNSFKL